MKKNEKAKNLTGTWKKLFGYFGKYKILVVIALCCAAVATVFTLLGPNRLSDITDYVTEGIQPDTDKLTEIAEDVSENLSENLTVLTEEISENLGAAALTGTENTNAVSSTEIPAEDSSAYLTASAVPDEIIVNGISITPEEQMETLEILSDLDMEDEDSLLSALNGLPQSVLDAIYTDIEVDGVTISGADQQETIEILADLDTDDSETALAQMDELPESVYSLIKPSMNLTAIGKIGLFLVTIYIISWVLHAMQAWIMATATQRVSQRMRSDISNKINRLPMGYYNTTSTGDVLSRVTNDVDMIGQSMNQSLSMLVTAVVQFIGCLIMMFITNAVMTLTAIVACAIGFLLMFLIMGHSQKYFTRQQRNLGALNGHVEEIYAGHTVVKAYNGEKEAEETFDKLNHDLLQSGFRAQCLAGLMMPIMTFIGNFGYVAVCIVGGAMALNGRISFGVIVAFMIYVRLFTSPLSQISQAMQSLQTAAAAGERIFEFLEAEDMEDESGKTRTMGKAKGTVEFDHVKFGYTDKTIIHDFSAKALPGQKIAIVGPTGAGKTTLVNLLMRFYETDSGEIRIDGVPTRELTREDVHAQFCMVLQDTWVFEGTVRENLVYCTENVSDEKIAEACAAVGLDHFIRTLPQGYDTVLDDQLNLSQGQKQQLTIARAMIADKPMLILDEATSSVDTRTEQLIQSAMDRLMENRTSFVIANRLSTIKNSDLILVLKDGDVIESGTHEELLAQKGFYAELYNSQFEQAS
ncbi:MAG: ABC transporter ATP-binding protein/permease [Clostridiales bacterium]|nr:ABC transporter ATP-binding protein/permease [Clostridiales bacterium]